MKDLIPLIITNIVKLILRTLYRIKVKGINDIPQTGPVIIASNHLSYLDPPILGMIMPRKYRFVAMHQLFSCRPLALFMRMFNTISIKKGTPDKNAYREIIKTLQNGNIILLFPEGTRSYNGNLQPFESGAPRIALLEGIPIVPTTITGTFEAYPRRKAMPKFCVPITVKFHKPIKVNKIEDKRALKSQATVLCEQIANPLRRRTTAYKKLIAKEAKN